MPAHAMVEEARRRQSSGSGEGLEVLLRRGLEAHQEGRLEEALGAYEEVLARSPDNGDALNLVGVVLHQQGDNAG